MVNYLKEIFNELNTFNIRYAVLRGYETLPYEVSHDIDFGVDVADLKQMIEILKKVSTKNFYQLVYVSKRKDIVQLYFYNKGYCLKIDLWTDFSYKGLKYLNIQSMLNNTKIHNNIKVLKEDDELSLSFLKEFLHNGWIREDKLVLLNEKLSKLGIFKSTSIYLNKDNKEDFTSYILQSKTSLKKESNRFKKTLFFKNLKINGLRHTMMEILDYGIKYINDFVKKKSFFIVLIGPDGSGKTTLAKKIITEVEEKTCCFTSSYYLHGRFGIIPNLATLMGKEKEKTDEMKFGVEKTKELPPHSILKITIYMTYYSIDFALGFFKLLKMRFSHKVIVADRYFYDYFYQEHFKKFPKILYFLYMKVLPAPDLVIFLKADAKAIYERKPELSIARINMQQQNIQKILVDVKHSIIIDSAKELEDTYTEIRNNLVLKNLS